MSAQTKKRKTGAPDASVHPHKKPKLADTKEDNEFHLLTASLVLSVPPIFASNPENGVREMLDSMIMRYIPALRGVVLAHSNITFLKPTASINADCPFLNCHIQFDATVWCPRVRMKLTGKISLCSPDHISLLIHRTFNVSIPRHHIPTDEWEFEQGPAGDEPESDDDPSDDKTGGRWVHKITGKILGGPNGYLEFAVIGLTVANEMLSLLGSIQHDPFSPEHVAVKPTPRKTAAEREDVDSEEDSDSEDDLEVKLKVDKGKRKKQRVT